MIQYWVRNAVLFFQVEKRFFLLFYLFHDMDYTNNTAYRKKDNNLIGCLGRMKKRNICFSSMRNHPRFIYFTLFFY